MLSLPNEKIIEICNNLSDSDLANLLRSNSILNDACKEILDARKEDRKLYIQDKIKQSLINKSQIAYYPKRDTYSNVVNVTFDPREGKYTLTHLVKYDNIEDILKEIDKITPDNGWNLTQYGRNGIQTENENKRIKNYSN